MKFNSNSITLNGGLEIYKTLTVPIGFESYSVEPEVWKESISEFNGELNKRDNLMESIDDIDVDLLYVDFTDKIRLRMYVMEKYINNIRDMVFILRGEVILGNETTSKVDKIRIRDIQYMEDSVYVSIFKK